MSKCHMALLYVGLALAIAGIGVLYAVISEQQERIAGLEERAVALDGWANSVEERLVSQRADADSNQRRIAGLEERQVAINDWANSIEALLHRGSTEDRRRIGAVESQIASLQRSSTQDRRRVSAVESRIASLQRASTEDRRRISAVESRTSTRAPQPSQQAVSPELVEALDAFQVWSEGVADWQNNYARWRRSVESRLQCTVSATVVKDIIAVVGGDITKVPRLVQQGAALALGC